MISRVSNNQIETDIPLRDCLEACWRAFKKYGLENCVIDIGCRAVQGTSARSLLTYGKIITAQIEDNIESRLISISIEEVNLGNTDLGGNKRFLRRLCATIKVELSVAPVKSPEVSLPKNSPIPSPHGGPVPQSANPVFGSVAFVQRTKPRRGAVIFLCGLLGLLSIVFALVTLVCGGLSLKDYFNDPSQGKRITFDIVLVIVGMLFGALGILISLSRM